MANTRQRGVFGHRDFTLLATASLVSGLGTQASVIANALLIKSLTNSGFYMGLTLGLSALVWVILGPLGGVVADRYPRRRILVCSDLFCSLIMGGLALTLYLEPSAQFQIIAIFTATILLSAANTFFMPAVRSLAKDLLPPTRLASGNSVLQGITSLTNVIGRALGGLAYQAFGPLLVSLMDAVSYVVSGFSVRHIRQDGRAHELLSAISTEDLSPSKKALPNSLVPKLGGLELLRTVPGMVTAFCLVGILNLFNAGILTVLPFYNNHLGLPVAWYGLFSGAIAFGLFCGSALVWVPRFKVWNGWRPMTIVLVAASLFRMITAISKNGWLSLLSLGLENACYGFFNVHTFTHIQLRVPSAYLGRVLGMMNALVIPLAPVGMILMGAALDQGQFPLTMIVLLSGIGILDVACMSYWLTGWRQFFDS